MKSRLPMRGGVIPGKLTIVDAIEPPRRLLIALT
jgi:hypothetical protein